MEDEYIAKAKEQQERIHKMRAELDRAEYELRELVIDYVNAQAKLMGALPTDLITMHHVDRAKVTELPSGKQYFISVKQFAEYTSLRLVARIINERADSV